MKRLALISLTSKGKALAEVIIAKGKERYTFDVYEKEKESLKDFVKREFYDCYGLIFISAAGIAVRYIAPYIVSKDKDPAVVVIDDCGKNAISLLSGHLGGGNRLTLEIADIIGANPVITTATDINEKFAVDVWSKDAGCEIADIHKIKYISSSLLEGRDVGLVSDFDIKGAIPKGLVLGTEAKTGISVSLDESKEPFEKTLTAVPKIVTLGVGCRKNTDSKVFEERILEMLDANRISIKSIEKVVSIDLKKKEKCILDFCRKYDMEFETFSAEELMSIEGDFDSSEFVRKTTGCDNVCERSCVFSSGGSLIMKKNGAKGVTCACSIRKWECKF